MQAFGGKIWFKEKGTFPRPNPDAGTHEAELFALLRRRDSFGNTFFATFLVSDTAAAFVFLIVLFAHNFCCFGVIKISGNCEKESNFARACKKEKRHFCRFRMMCEVLNHEIHSIHGKFLFTKKSAYSCVIGALFPFLFF